MALTAVVTTKCQAYRWHDGTVRLYSTRMSGLILNRRLNHRNIQLTDETKGQSVGYLRPDGSQRYVRWLGFIAREDARRLEDATPVRLVCISRTGVESRVSASWRDVPADRLVHGCLTPDGAYALFDRVVATVPLREFALKI